MTGDKVYLIEGGGLIKIGVTTAVGKRLATLQTTSPVPLTLVKAWSCADGAKLEDELHERCACWRRHGEWFELPEEALKSLCAELDELEKTWMRLDEARNELLSVEKMRRELEKVHNQLRELEHEKIRLRAELERGRQKLNQARNELKDTMGWQPGPGRGRLTIRQIHNRGGSVAWYVQGRVNGQHIRRRFKEEADAITFRDKVTKARKGAASAAIKFNGVNSNLSAIAWKEAN